jgi:hypothetical protein
VIPHSQADQRKHGEPERNPHAEPDQLTALGSLAICPMVNSRPTSVASRGA